MNVLAILAFSLLVAWRQPQGLTEGSPFSFYQELAKSFILEDRRTLVISHGEPRCQSIATGSSVVVYSDPSSTAPSHRLAIEGYHHAKPEG